MKVLRSAVIAGLAVFAAACGDKVTVKETTPDTTPKVNSVTVSPNAASLSIGNAITFTAIVDVSNGAAQTVTWGSSDATKVSVNSSTGVATAVAATPGISICATSTADATKKGCAQVVVNATVNVPATVSIQSITATGTNNVTVNPAAVVGNIDVRLNVNPGSQTITKVQLMIGTVVAGTQTFTAAQSAALRFAADAAVDQTTFPQILFSVNTAAYSCTAAGICTPTFANGSPAISAQVFTAAGGSTAAAATATTQTSYTLANVDGFDVTTTNPTGSAVDALGFRWTGNGALVINARPVMYSGRTVGAVTASLSSVATVGTCVGGTSSGTGAGSVATGTATATTPTAGVWVNSLALTAYQNQAGCTGVNALFPTITAADNNGNALTLVTGGVLNTAQNPGSFNANPALVFRYDNVPPATPGLIATVAAGAAGVLNGRSNNWINGTVVFNAVGGAGATVQNNWIAAAVADAGVGLGTAGAGITYSVKVGQGTATTAATLASATGGTAFTNATTLAQTSLLGGGFAVQDCAVPYAADALGNTTLSPTGTCAAPTVPAGGAAPAAGVYALQFGVDLANPTASFSTSAAAANMAANAGLTALTQMRAIATDTGLVGNSGFIGGTSVFGITGTITRRTAAATSTTAVTVPAGAVGTGTNTTVPLSRIDGSALLVADTLVFEFAGITTNAYYTLSATFLDQAGNPANGTGAAGTPIVRTVLKDATPPTALAPVQNIVNPTAGGPITFNSQVSDDLDLANGSLTATFIASQFPVVLNVAGAVIANPSTATAISLVGPITFNTYNTAPANGGTVQTLAATIPALFALQSHQTDSVTIGATGNAYPASLNAVVNDMNAANTATSAAGTVQNPPAVPAAFVIGPATPANDYTKFLLSRSGTTINVSGSGTAGAVFTRNITPRMEGSTVQPAPFTSVDIYVGINGAANAYTFVGTSTLTAQTDNGGLRVWSFSAVPYTITAGIAAGADKLVFIGLGKGAAGRWIAGQGITLTVSP